MNRLIQPLLLLCLLCGCGTFRGSGQGDLLPAPSAATLPDLDIAIDELEPGVWIHLDQTEEEPPAAAIEPPEPGPYRLEVGDVLDITIYGVDGAKRIVPIDPAGNITYMLLGTIPAAGRTIDELTADMQARLSQKMNFAILSISPVRFGSQTFTVLGQMNNPQVYPIRGRTYLLDAIAAAGGPRVGLVRGVTADMHDFSHATLIRNGEVLPVDFERLVYDADASQNVEILAGDIITIPSVMERKIYALGAFNAPQGIQFTTSHISLMNAVVQAGGINRDLSDGHIIIVRGNFARPAVLYMDLSQLDVRRARAFKVVEGRALDINLRPGDIVYAVPKEFRFLRDVIKGAVTTFGNRIAGDAAAILYDRRVDPFNLR